jgi:hypothetical protein
LFDVGLIVLALAEVIIFYSMDYKIFPILRSMRILRIIKVVKIFKQLRDLIVTLSNALMKVLIYIALLAIFMFTFTIMGMELFSYNARVDSNGQTALSGGYPFDMSFDYFLDAFKSVFVILTNDNWTYVLQIHY